MTAETATDETTRTHEKQCKTREIPVEIAEICEFLSANDAIVFKSQQIDDPELQRNEKVTIAYDIFRRSRPTFLRRFGAHLEERHIATLASMLLPPPTSTHRSRECGANDDGDSDGDNDPNNYSHDDDEEVQMMLKDFQHKLQTRKLNVKNRRYTALKKLIRKGEYFSEFEMMKRAPELYQDLVGQYLSEEEKKARDGYDVKHTTFSGILMHTMQQREIADLLNEADKSIENKDTDEHHDSVHDDDDVDEDKTEEEEEEEEQPSTAASSEDDAAIAVATKSVHGEATCDQELYDVPVAFRQQWGNFDDEQVACSTSKRTNVVKPISKALVLQQQRPKEIKFITAGERDLLRQEFVGLMHEHFLAGLDDEFDYSQVDDDSQLDDLRQLDQDKEDAYFEASDDDDDSDVLCENAAVVMEDQYTKNNTDESEEEEDDDLDIFMQHLQKHQRNVQEQQ